MRFVDNDAVVFVQKAVVLSLRQQNTVGHQFDAGVVITLVGKAHLIPHRLPQRCLQFIGDALSHRARRQPARLGVANTAFNAQPGFEANFW